MWKVSHLRDNVSKERREGGDAGLSSQGLCRAKAARRPHRECCAQMTTHPPHCIAEKFQTHQNKEKLSKEKRVKVQLLRQAPLSVASDVSPAAERARSPGPGFLTA